MFTDQTELQHSDLEDEADGPMDKPPDACAEVSDEEELEPTSTKAQKNKRTKRTDACAEVSDEEELEPTSTKAQKNKRTKRTDACAEVSDEEELEPTSTKAQKNKRTKRTDEASRNPGVRRRAVEKRMGKYLALCAVPHTGVCSPHQQNLEGPQVLCV
uniref:Uncharacterized protein n=1 Tax=Knipowitschia caucasica TaxID=637954 RepID=A0AAV2KJ09_KNICA